LQVLLAQNNSDWRPASLQELPSARELSGSLNALKIALRSKRRKTQGRATVGLAKMAWRNALSKNLQELRCCLPAWDDCHHRLGGLIALYAAQKAALTSCNAFRRILLCQTSKGSEGARCDCRGRRQSSLLPGDWLPRAHHGCLPLAGSLCWDRMLS
jgi:hypothetical protein